VVAGLVTTAGRVEPDDGEPETKAHDNGDEKDDGENSPGLPFHERDRV
jgi:hypothetical protein